MIDFAESGSGVLLYCGLTGLGAPMARAKRRLQTRL